VALGCTVIGDWPDDVQWYVLTVKRKALKTEPERGLWAFLKSLARGLTTPTRHSDAPAGATIPPEREIGQ